MEIKYDIYTIKNAVGNGDDRQYVRLVQHEPMDEKQLQARIQDRCSLTKGDVAAVLAELHDIAVSELAGGHRVFIPGIGYFSLSASLEMPEDRSGKKITGREVRITGINFRPEATLMQEVQSDVSFVRSRFTTQSVQYREETLLERIKDYLQTNRYLTVSIMRTQFGLTRYATDKWLRLFCDRGILVKDGTRHSPIYFLK